jgi:hypothetical protein
MTVLGKILVFVNLVFSLITGALIIMVFVTRTNWKASFDDLSKKYQAQQNINRAYAADIEKITKEKEAEEAKVLAVKKEAKDTETRLAGELANMRSKSLQNEQRAMAAETALEANTAEKTRRQQEVDHLKTVNAEKERKLGELEVAIKEFRDRAVSAEISYKAALDRNGRLLEQVEKMAKENQTLRNSQAVLAGGAGAGVSPGKQPPPEDLKGSILEVDVQAGLLTISLGSDSGLKEGNTLEVYHLDPKPEYLGTVRIVDTHFKYAVARPVAPLKAAQLTKGDIVASRITGR